MLNGRLIVKILIPWTVNWRQNMNGRLGTKNYKFTRVSLKSALNRGTHTVNERGEIQTFNPLPLTL